MALRRIGFGLLGLVAVVALALGVLAWRLDRAPIAVPSLLPRITAALDTEGPARMEVGEAHIAWGGWRAGGFAPLELRLSGVRGLDAEGRPWIEAPSASIGLRPAALLRGQAEPRFVELHEPRVTLRRDAAGTFHSGIGPLGGQGAGAPPGLAAIARPPPGSPLAALDRLAITGGHVLVRDEQLGRDWVLDDLSLLATRRLGGTMEAEASATLAIDAENVPLHLAATLESDPARLRLALDLPRVNPGALARLSDVLGPLSVLDAEAAISARMVLEEDLRASELEATVKAGAGKLDLPVAGGVPIQGMELRLAGSPQALRLEQLDVRLSPAPESPPGSPGPLLQGQGKAAVEAGRWKAELDVALDRAELAALETWWPAGLAPAARGWVTGSLVGGTLHDGRWHIVAEADEALGNIAMTTLSGSARIENVAVKWHPDLPALEGLTGDIAFEPDGITLTAQEARQSGTGLVLRDGRLRLSSLGAGPTRAELDGKLSGPIGDLWTVLNLPGLGLLEGKELPIHDPTGSFTADIGATVPLSGPLVAAEPFIRASGRITELVLPRVILGQTLRNGEFTIRASDTEGLKAEGNGTLGRVPVQTAIELVMPDRPGQAVGVKVSADARLDAARLADFGLDPGSLLEGPLGLAVRYELRGTAPARLTVDADLRPTRIALPAVGYRKAGGAAATAHAVLVMRGGTLAGIESARAEGPELLLRASAARGIAPGATLTVQEARFGQTRLAGTVQRPEAPGAPWLAALRGPVLDLRPLLSGASEDGGGGAPPIVVEARFDRALTPDPAPPLRDLQARVVIAGGGALSQLQAAGQLGEAAAARFTTALAPAERGGRLLRVQAQDAGALIAALGYGRRIEGGQLDLAATLPGEAGLTPPVSGVLRMADFSVRDAPTIGKVLQAITLYGLVEALNGPGLAFARLEMPFRLERDTLVIGEAHAFSASLGVTVTGRVDRARELLDLRGTIVPAYVFNSLLGNLPLVGRLFSAERGGGLISTGYEVKGPLANPSVTVNPLTALTPGALRGLFNLGTNEADATTGAQPPPPQAESAPTRPPQAPPQQAESTAP